MTTENPIFGLKVKNLAIINIRQESDTYLAMLSDEKFVRRIGNLGTPIDLPLITWRGLPMGLLTFMLQRSILGVESCVSAAVYYRLGARGFAARLERADHRLPRVAPPMAPFGSVERPWACGGRATQSAQAQGKIKHTVYNGISHALLVRG